MFSAMDVSTSGLTAQRARLNTISGNLANISTIVNERGEQVPYQPRYVTLQVDEGVSTRGGGKGVRVASVEHSTAEPIVRYEPGHPLADERGMVAYPNIDMTNEFVDALEATRAYEANIGVMEISKDLGRQTLQIIA
ncbi:MAG: flagellar basal body rod protein FlgC [Planctomycetota bacterium]